VLGERLVEEIRHPKPHRREYVSIRAAPEAVKQDPAVFEFANA
jgi:hypothetical protein